MRFKLFSLLVHTHWSRDGFWKISKAPYVTEVIFGIHAITKNNKTFTGIYLGPIQIQIGIP